MPQSRILATLDRIDAALARIESRPVVDAARHERLRAAIADAVAGLDRTIADAGK